MFTSILAFLSPLLGKAKTVVSKNPAAWILGILVVILITALAIVNNSRQNEVAKLKIDKQNLLAANDSVRVSYTKDKQVEFDKYANLAQTANDLKKVNADLYNQVKVTKGQVETLVAANAKLVDSGNLKTVVIHDTTTKDSNGVVHVDKEVELSLDTTYSKGNYHKISTTVHIAGVPDSLDIKGTLAKDEIGFTIITGIKKNADGNYEIFARSGYPGATITSLEGALIDKHLFQQPDKRHIFTIGANFGYLPIIYDWKTKSTDVLGSKLGVSLGVNVNFTELFRKK